MKVIHISDTHGYHCSLPDFLPADMIIHSGDATNYRDPYKNEPEFLDFIDWYSSLNISYKIFVAGNHDTALERFPSLKNKLKEAGITYIEHEYIEIEGLKIFGSPYTPTFGNWAFMKSRESIGRLWDQIPQELDILITHGPPKYILDINGDGVFCGCGALAKAIDKRDIGYHMFGHIHSNDILSNHGLRLLGDTVYSNAAFVKDGKGFTNAVNYLTL
jgi:Icc-related predicted phosphoesterase